MSFRGLAATLLTAAGVCTLAAPARADDTFKLGFGPASDATVSKLDGKGDADTIDVKGRGGYGGGSRGGVAVSSYRGGVAVASYRGGYGYGGYRGGYGYGGYRGGYGYGYGGYYGGYRRGYGYGGYYGFGPYYGGFYSPYIYSYPYYSYPIYSYPTYTYPSYVNSTLSTTPNFSYYNFGPLTTLGATTLDAPPTPAPAPAVISQSPYGQLLPAPSPVQGNGTFPYDGGPSRSVPMPRIDSGFNEPAPLPQGRPVSLPVEPAKRSYPAYGEKPTPKVTPTTPDKAKTYVTKLDTGK